MKFTLKDYQADAVGDVLACLARGRVDFHQFKAPSSFALTATTGAGKTVMAAAVLEALFDGNPDYDFEADPTAVVLWFTDDPALNAQTRFRLLEASDRLPYSRLKVIENTFNQEKLDPGTVYFLNAQKLSKTSLLVKGAVDAEDSGATPLPAMPDARAFTMWDTLRNTIEDENLTLYLILDEAHRGMRTPSARDRSARQTIVKQLINGAHGAPPVPIVWGISATVERFTTAMAEAKGRTSYPSIVVSPARVQESGLLKDDIRLDFPAEAGDFDTVLLKRATRQLKEQTASWTTYCAKQDPPLDPVVPLMVLQVPNTPSDELLALAVATVREEWTGIETDAFAHVFGDHATLDIGGMPVPYVSPEKVQDATHIRVLLAKDAISTGWDCPRAEVLMSFRPAQDETHITQLLGRMVRTPLARRIPGDDRLNSVECVLPKFNRATATAVADVLLGNRTSGDDETGGTGGGDGRRVLFKPVDMHVNDAIPDAVWAAYDRLPSQTLPRKAAKPTRRLSALAQALSRDALLPDARKLAYTELCAVLDGLRARHKAALATLTDDLLEVSGETVVAGVKGGTVRIDGAFTELADDRSVDADFKAAGRILTPDLARVYADHIAEPDGDDDGLFEAHITVAALARIDGVQDELHRAAAKLASKWLDEHRVAIKGLPDERRAVYDDIIAMTTDPQRIDLIRPSVRTEETEEADGIPVPTVGKHLMSDAEGRFPIASLNGWERDVINAELGRSIAWYRNPSRASADSLAVAWTDEQGNWRRMCPDFIFFSGSPAEIKVSIVDPHGIHLGDALGKLRGLSDFAEQFAADFHRVEAVAKLDDSLRVLDITQAATRTAIRAASDAGTLYRDHAVDYK